MTCLSWRVEQRKHGRANYWRSPEGVENRVLSIAQMFAYRLYNGAMKLVADQLKGVTWMIWVTADDDRVCPICRPRHLKRYRTHWFLPEIPAHVSCRCQWMVIYE